MYNNINNPFISESRTINLVENSDFLKDNSSSSSSIEITWDSFKSALFDNKSYPKEDKIESINIDQSEEEIRKLMQVFYYLLDLLLFNYIFISI